jgi:hypothetical protein
MDEPSAVMLGCMVALLILFVGFIVGNCVGSYNTVSYTEVIQHGAAHYAPATAKFTWNSSATAPTVNREKQQ